MFDSEFVDRAPWWGGDLQTIRNELIRPIEPPMDQGERLEFPTLDGSGDILVGMLDTPEIESEEPLIMLIHGLTGNHDSSYMRASAQFHLEQGRKVLRLNLRGAGPTQRTCKSHYSAVYADDIRAVLEGLPEWLRQHGVFAVGYSFGGNILINALAKPWAAEHFVGGATVSAPLRPVDAANRLKEPRNHLYQKSLLARMKVETLSPCAQLDADEQSAIHNAQSIYEFDDTFTAPRFGFRDAEDYYLQTGAARFVRQLVVPTLLIHARNDPWIPVAMYDDCQAVGGRNAFFVITTSGGHVGFHEQGYTATRHDRAIGGFLSHTASDARFA